MIYRSTIYFDICGKGELGFIKSWILSLIIDCPEFHLWENICAYYNLSTVSCDISIISSLFDNNFLVEFRYMLENILWVCFQIIIDCIFFELVNYRWVHSLIELFFLWLIVFLIYDKLDFVSRSIMLAIDLDLFDFY